MNQEENNNSSISEPTIKTYIINLNDPPRKRWQKVVNDYKHLFGNVLKEIDSILASAGFFGTIARWMCKAFNKFDKLMYREELRSISFYSGFPIDKLILMQICYEMFSACTSLVMNNGKEGDENMNIHFRTMDWEMDFLKELTIHVKFIKDDNIVFEGITWAGYVGIVTGMSSSYSLAVNYRRSNGTLLGNVFRTMTMKWPVGYLVRYILEQDMNINRAMRVLENTQLISPCYITICPSSGNAFVLIRDCDKLIKRRSFDTGKSYLVQTNCDNLDDINDIMWSKQRINTVNKIMETCQVDEKQEFKELYKMFFKHPIINPFTIYSSLLVPKKNILLSTIH